MQHCWERVPAVVERSARLEQYVSKLVLTSVLGKRFFQISKCGFPSALALVSADELSVQQISTSNHNIARNTNQIKPAP